MFRKVLVGLVLVGLLGSAEVFLLRAEESPILLQDDFSDAERSKEIWEGKHGFPTSHLYVKDGALSIDVLKTGTAVYAGDENWGDYIFNVKIKFIKRGEGDNHSGFCIRSAKESGSVKIIGRENRISYNISGVITETGKGLDQEKRKVALDDGKWHYFRFICKGSTINVWADGEEIGTIKQAPLKGKIVLYGFNTITEFDDVMVMKIGE